jgi:(1->4)-alpha-D-glucan 1-alpha-D-glucosylmutase
MAAAGADRRALAHELLASKADGAIKLYVTLLALNCRRSHTGLFTAGDYLPAQALGARSRHVFGFLRRQGDCAAVVAVPRLIAGLLAEGHDAPLGQAVWQDTRLFVPGIDPKRHWRNVLTGESVVFAVDDGQPALMLAPVLAHCPVALLVA